MGIAPNGVPYMKLALVLLSLLIGGFVVWLSSAVFAKAYQADVLSIPYFDSVAVYAAVRLLATFVFGSARSTR